MASDFNNTSTFDLEVVYHLEGKPNLSAATQAVVAVNAGSGYSPSPSKPIGMLRVVEAAAHEPVVKKVVEELAGFIHPMLGKLAGAILSVF